MKAEMHTRYSVNTAERCMTRKGDKTKLWQLMKAEMHKWCSVNTAEPIIEEEDALAFLAAFH